MVKNVYLDTNIFIYLFEEIEPYKTNFINLVKNIDYRYYTSSFTLGELLVNVFKQNRPDLASLYIRKIKDFVEDIIAIDESTSIDYAKTRASFPKISKPDVLHISCALQKCEIFLTNDERLLNCVIPGLKMKGIL